jgi:hypothetical protein
MRRKLNEGEEFNEELLDGVKICVSDIRNDDSAMDCNELRDIFVEAGAEVFGSHGLKNGKPATFMTVKGLPEEKVVEILQDFLNNSDTCDDAEAYEVNDNIDPETQSYLDADEPDYPAYEDVEADDLDPEEDVLNDVLNEGEDILEDAQEELRGLLSNLGENDNITFEPEIVLGEEYEGEDGEGNIAVVSIDCNGDMEVLNGDQVINAFDLTDADDIFTLCDIVKDELDNEVAYPAYDDVDDEDEELPRFEKFHKGRHLDEKKKNNCCPGTKNLNESVIDTVLADLDAKKLNESKEVEKKNQKELEKKTLKALTENKHSLHTNVRYNGKTFAKMTLKELKSIYETVKASVDVLSERSLNESVVDTKMIETINKKKQLLEFLDEEITYRTTRMECLSKLNEDSAEISDEELANLFGPAQGEDEASADNGDDDAESEDSNEEGEKNKEGNEDENNDEEVELSRIEITLKDAEAANDLKQACLDADIPEDAFELENVEDEDAFEEEGEEPEENSEESLEDSSEENTDEENSEEGANESYEFSKYVKMLGEGEVADEQSVDDVASEESGEEENGAENTEGEGDEENSEEEEEDKQPKFILTNTDYASKLAKVLEDVYGISKEEFEDMIGGEIVEEEPKEDEENSDEDGSENSEESKDEESKDSSEEKKDDEEDELDPSDLFKNL